MPLLEGCPLSGFHTRCTCIVCIFSTTFYYFHNLDQIYYVVFRMEGSLSPQPMPSQITSSMTPLSSPNNLLEVKLTVPLCHCCHPSHMMSVDRLLMQLTIGHKNVGATSSLQWWLHMRLRCSKQIVDSWLRVSYDFNTKQKCIIYANKLHV